MRACVGAEHCNLLGLRTMRVPLWHNSALQSHSGSLIRLNTAPEAGSSNLPESISKILIYPIRRITTDPLHPKDLQCKHLRLAGRLHTLGQERVKKSMPQEVSVSYQAIKSKVYRLIDALVVGEKTDIEVQESIRRWWDLIHPADRPIAQKYLQAVLERSCHALDAVEEGLSDATQNEAMRPSESSRALRLAGRVVKQAPLSSTMPMVR